MNAYWEKKRVFFELGIDDIDEIVKDQLREVIITKIKSHGKEKEDTELFCALMIVYEYWASGQELNQLKRDIKQMEEEREF